MRGMKTWVTGGSKVCYSECMGITRKTIQAIKAAPLSSVVEGLGGVLKRVGHEFLTQCLWHDDTNPSLTINDQKGFCFCHVCRQGGDAIDYVMQRKGLTMREAAEEAASLLGVPFETDDVDAEEAARRREQLKRESERLQVEQRKYRNNLRDPRAGRVRDMLKGRGLTAEASKEFGLGYSPSGFFGGRITIPIHDHRGRLVGWTGRATKPGQNAKYKNSAESELFQKKSLVFNEHRGLEAAREAGCLIFVEGHLDVVSMWQAGIRNVVAMQGTGAPDLHALKRMARSVKNFVLCYDGDAGGKKAVEQFVAAAGPMAMEGQLNINVVSLPEGQDPDEVIRSGVDLYSYIASAPSWLDWVIDSWAASLDINDGAMVTEVESRLHKLINGLRSNALRTHYIDKAARVLSASDKEAENLAKNWSIKQHVEIANTWEPRSPHEIRLAAERRLLRIFIHCPTVRDQIEPLVDKMTNPALRWLWERLKELREHCLVDLTPHSVMAIVAVAEPHYMQQLRTLVRPNVIIDSSEGVLDHISDIMGKDLVPETLHESNPDQPSS